MLIITGSVAYDYIMQFPDAFGNHILPDQLHNINISFICNGFEKRRGGTAGNASYALGLLGTEHMVYTYVGKDFADYEKELKRVNLEMKGIRIDPTVNTATGFALTDNEQNQIWGFFYGPMEQNTDLKLRDIAHANDLVLVGPQGAVSAMSFVRQCKELKLSYMFDPGFILTQISDGDLRSGLKSASYVIGNEYEVTMMKSRIKDFDDLISNKICITTFGIKGAIIASKGEMYSIPSVMTDSVVNTTGAGDAWRGGFLSGIEKGCNLQVAGQMGAVAGSYAVEHTGTQEYVYSKEGFIERYKKAFNETISL